MENEIDKDQATNFRLSKLPLIPSLERRRETPLLNPPLDRRTFRKLKAAPLPAYFSRMTFEMFEEQRDTLFLV